MRCRTPALAVLLAVVATLAVLVPDGAVWAKPSAPATPSASASAPAPRHTRPAYTPPPRALFFSNPKRHPRGVTDQLLRLIRNAHRRSVIEVSTYFLGSSLIAKALAAARLRGVRNDI